MKFIATSRQHLCQGPRLSSFRYLRLICFSIPMRPLIGRRLPHAPSKPGPTRQRSFPQRLRENRSCSLASKQAQPWLLGAGAPAAAVCKWPRVNMAARRPEHAFAVGEGTPVDATPADGLFSPSPPSAISSSRDSLSLLSLTTVHCSLPLLACHSFSGRCSSSLTLSKTR